MDRLSGWLRARGAQTDVVVWAEAFGDDWALAWSACPRGDWLLALAARAGLKSAKVGRAALAVARFGIEDVSVEALPVPDILAQADRALAGMEPAALEMLLEHAHRFERASNEASDPTLAVTLLSIACALRAGTHPDEAASVAALVAQAAVFSAGDCAMTAALGYAQRRSADLVREHISAADWIDAARALR